jgi:protein-tyrosine phosphatase
VPRELFASGIRSVLTLSAGSGVSPEELAAAGLRHRHVPLLIGAPPIEGDLERALELVPQAVAWLRAELAAGRPTLVHCSAGRDRTGLLLAAALQHAGAGGPREALQAVRAVRPQACSADGWEAFALEVLARLAPVGAAHV